MIVRGTVRNIVTGEAVGRYVRTRRFICHYGGGLWWFRLYGFGLHWKDVRRERELLDDRYGKARWSWRLGPYRFGVLWPGHF